MSSAETAFYLALSGCPDDKFLALIAFVMFEPLKIACLWTFSMAADHKETGDLQAQAAFDCAWVVVQSLL